MARIPRPPVARLEYLLDIVSATGERQLVCDPANPLRAPGVFGDKSVVELPGYTVPRWLTDVDRVRDAWHGPFSSGPALAGGRARRPWRRGPDA